ncbi:MAG: TRAP transporter small permease [Desulfobacteraceae bacterium]|nr:MAG: TRAP transporter small permease [Desulfobacteraceae bacterium]
MTSSDWVQKVENGLFPLVKFIDRLSWVMLFAMMAMTITDLFLRNFTNSGILGSVELTEFMMIIVVFCSLAQCEVNDGHIRVDLVMNSFGPRARLFADLFTQTLCTALFALMTLSVFHHALNMRSSGEVTMDLHLPIYPFVFIAAFGCLVMTAVLFVKVLSLVLKAVQS